MLKALRGEQILGGGSPPAPDSWSAVLDSFNKTYDDMIAELRDPKNPELNGTAEFFVAPKQTGDIPIPEFLEFVLHDQIHHRGQLSVYLRLAKCRRSTVRRRTNRGFDSLSMKLE